ncbi:MAG: site-2 protease family protein [Phycisphaerae bacterium]
MRTRGAPYTITVARAPQDNPDGEDQEVTVNVDSELMIRSDVFALTRAENMKLEPPNILGFAPRVAVADVTRGRPAEDAGLKHGDVITRVGPIANPTMPLIFRVIGESKMQPIEMEILRGEETKIVTVRPEPVDRVKPWGDKSPFIGLDPNWLEQDRVVIADVIAGSVAANAGVPRGATVLRVNDREVGSWTEFVLALLDNAGKRVALNVDSGGQKLDLAFEVPSSVVNELDLPPDVDFLAVNGAREITVDGVKKTIRTSSAFAAALQQNIGKEITLEFADHLGLGTAQKRTFTVTEENWQPWQLQAQFRTPLVLSVRPVLHKVDAGGNPLRAINMAGKMTYQNVIGTYQSMRQVANKKVSTENLSGPVGIFSVAMTVAEHGFAELLFLLGFLSANLAVINFLPLPVMDGGLMAFLILEKIRGKPVTVKTQMISTMVGLAVIGLIFIAVTFQDVAKLFP